MFRTMDTAKTGVWARVKAAAKKTAKATKTAALSPAGRVVGRLLAVLTFPAWGPVAVVGMFLGLVFALFIWPIPVWIFTGKNIGPFGPSN